MADHPSVARVVLDVRLPQLDRLFDYAIPDGMAVRPGLRVRVPLGTKGRVVSGYVVDVGSASDFTGSLAQIESVVSDVEVLAPEMWTLAREVADRQAGSAADILRLAIPPRAARYEKSWLQRKQTPTHPPSCEIPEGPSQLSPDAWSKLQDVSVRIALTLPPGVVESVHSGQSVPGGFDLLARFAATILARGESVILAVPDWRDVELLSLALQRYCDDRHVVVWKGDGTPTERYAAFLRTRENEPLIVLGSRHALWAPVAKLGAIVLVSDGDSSHREPLAPYPHARDVALLRHTHSSARLIFADWVPSADSRRLIDVGFLEPVVSDPRHRPRVVPTALVSLDDQRGPGRLPSLAHRGISEALRDGPVLIQVYRSGYAPGLSCDGCGSRVRCSHCAGPIRPGENNRVPHCGWCAAPLGVFRCGQCGAGQVRARGHAVGRTLTELGKAFPGTPVVRADGEHPVVHVPSRPALVVATRGAEPVAHGGYRAVLLLDGDAMLGREALDAEVETLRAWEWAVSLAHPDAKVFLTDVAGDVVTHFAAGASAERVRKDWLGRKDLAMPPAVRVVSLTGGASAVRSCAEVAAAIEGTADSLGPVVLPDGRHRILVRTSYASAPQVAAVLRAEVMKQALSRRPPSERVRVVMDDRDALDDVARSAG